MSVKFEIFSRLANFLELCYTGDTMISTKKKGSIIKKSAKHDKDTGSAEVQIALLSERIEELASHLKKNPKDYHSRRGLLKLVADRRSHQRYLDNKKKKVEIETTPA